MKEHEIWVQGHRMNGDVHPAVKLATVTAKTFDDALVELIKEDETFSTHYDSRTHRFWGCLIFATEEKARARCG